ncbi:MAG: M55 family metallopeptidase [Bacteroidota bacterium]
MFIRLNTYMCVALVISLAVASTALCQTKKDRPIKILVYHDMEGLSGEDDWRMFSFRHKEQYRKGQELLVADVNAVIDGLFAGGASVVQVVDAHGSGNPDPDILLDRLDPRSSMVVRDKPFRQYVDLVEPGAYDAVAVVGMHAKTGSGGFASHTFTLGMDIFMNDMSITETELIGYSWGRVDVPVIFASGDDKLAKDLQTMPWIEFVTVKKATSGSTADLRPLEEVHAEMRQAAARAVRNIGKANAMKLATPIKVSLRVVPPAGLDRLKSVPGINYSENMVTFLADDFGKAYDGVIALIGVATAGYISVTNETIRKLPNGEVLADQIGDSLSVRWLDYESGRWKPEPPPAPPAGRKYYGAR